MLRMKIWCKHKDLDDCVLMSFLVVGGG